MAGLTFGDYGAGMRGSQQPSVRVFLGSLGCNPTGCKKCLIGPEADPSAPFISGDLFSIVLGSLGRGYRGTSLIRNNPPLGPYSRPMPGALWWS